MKIKKLSQESCDQLFRRLKDEYDNVKEDYHKHPRNFESLINRLGLEKIKSGEYSLDDDLFIREGFESDGLRLNLKTDGKGSYDFENARIIYTAFEGLTPFEANDERLWTRMTHEFCHKYVVDRWMKDTTISFGKINDRFFYRGNSQAIRARNGVARLWWIAHLTVQKAESDPDRKWMHTKAMCESQDFITSILERTMGTYENVRFAILETYAENRDSFGYNTSKTIQVLLRDLNNLGGVSLLSMIPKEEIKKNIESLLNSYNEKDVLVSEG
ncbi:DUF6339 family protein [Robiginitalea aurantiaca]|uniref:DUF6339 family protein n=1 Tax=Robiginitalea aurantiaca TaxID=3056915 RepID=A0ABT7WBD6_9FLAO|nr:DUF6339 family protein [Robiginitalea aurantiaca]MDM9630226.1 DUF6339 family protein [Robiginitalea aurantiaca]